MTPLLFWAVFVFGLSLAPAVPPNPSTAQGVLAALAFAPTPDIPAPFAVWFVRAAMALFPFGSPAFRLGAATAVLAGIAVGITARLLRHARGDAEGGSALWALEEQRRWTAAETAVLLFWALSGPVWMAARGRWEDALLMTLGAGSFERALSFGRTPSLGRAAAAGAVAGLAGAADPRFFLLLPLILVLAFWFAPARPDKRSAGRWAGESALLAAAAAAAYLLPAVLLVARDSATVGQTAAATRDLLARWFLAPASAEGVGARLRAAWNEGKIPVILTLGFSLFAWRGTDRRERRAVAAAWVSVVVVFLAPAVCPGGRPGSFFTLGVLVGLPSLARAARGLLRSLPTAGTALFLAPLLLLPATARLPPRHIDPEAWAGDVFRSAPPGAGLAARSPLLPAAGTYRQRVWGDRLDLRWTPGAPETFFPLGESTSTFAAWPVGFVGRAARSGEDRRRTPATLSMGRVPLLLAESGLDGANPDALAAAHRALGDAFFDARVPDQAEEEYLKGLAYRPEDPGLNAALGGLFLDYGETERAAAALDRATRLGATDPRVWRQSAKAEYQEGRLHQASARLDAAAQRFPRDADVKIEWAELLEKLDRPRDAARAWGAAADLRADDKFILWRLTQAWLRAKEPLKAYRAVESYLSLTLSEEERRDGEAFRGLLLDALNRAAPEDASGGDQTDKDGAHAPRSGGVDQ